MILYTMLYPGDPPLEVLRMSRAEFLAAHPRRPIEIGTLGPDGEYILKEQIPMAPDEIICDFCNADPGDEVWVYNGMRGYCRACAKQQWFEYLTPKPI